MISRESFDAIEKENEKLILKKLFWWYRNNIHLFKKIKVLKVDDANPNGKEVEEYENLVHFINRNEDFFLVSIKEKKHIGKDWSKVDHIITE